MYISSRETAANAVSLFSTPNHTPWSAAATLSGVKLASPHIHIHTPSPSLSFPLIIYELFACAAIGWWIIILVRCWQIRPTGIISVHCPRTSGRPAAAAFKEHDAITSFTSECHNSLRDQSLIHYSACFGHDMHRHY